MWIRKLVRTILNYSPLGRDATEAAQQLIMRLTRQPHEHDFLALRFVPYDALLIDVGANHGQSILSMQLVAPRATIVAFEPNVRLAEGIRNRWRRRGQVTVHAVGLSDREDIVPLYVPSYRGMVYDGLASLDRRESLEWFNSDVIYAFNPAHVSVAEIPCALRTLDSFAFSQPPYLIKVDAQGHEAAVLAGAAATIASARPVVLVEGAWRNPATGAHLRRNGYVQYEFRGSSMFARTSDESALAALNTFFITDDKRAEMVDRGAMFS